MAQAAADDEASMLRLQTAVENTGTSFDTAKKAIEDRIKAGQDLAFSDDETRNALSLLIAETGSYEEGMARLTAAQDLARGANISLESAAKLLGKTSDENTSALGRYGIQLGENATAQDVLNAVDAKFGGQAAAFASTGAADMLKFKDQVGEAQEQLGAYLLPAVIAVTGVLSTLVGVLTTSVIPTIDVVVGFIRDNFVPILLAAAPAIVALGVSILSSAIPAFIAWTVQLYAQVVAWLALNASMLPIIAVVLAIGAAIAGLYLLWQSNFLGIQDITKSVIDFVLPYIQQAMAAIQAVVETVLPIVSGAFSTAWSAIQTVVETVLPIIQTVIETYLAVYIAIITTALDVILAVFQTVFPIIQSVVETVLPIIAAVVGTYINAVLAVVQTVLPLVLTVFQTVWEGIRLYVETVLAAIGLAVQVGMFLIKDIVGPILGALKSEVWDPTWNALKATVDTLLGAGGSIISAVTTGMGLVQSAVETILGGIETVWNATWGRLASAASTILGAVQSAWNAVAGTINAGLSIAESVINTLISGYNKLPGVPNINPVSIGGWLPTFGSSGSSNSAYGPTSPPPPDITQVPGMVTGGGQKPGDPGWTSGGGQKPVPGGDSPPDVGEPVDNGYINPLTGTGNLSGGSNLGSISGGGNRGGALSAQQSSDVAQMVAAGVPADQAIAAVQSSGGTSSGSGGGRSGGVVFNSAAGYRRVQMANGMTGYVATGSDAASDLKRLLRLFESGAGRIQQHFHIEDRSPAAIANAVEMAGIKLATELELQGVRC